MLGVCLRLCPLPPPPPAPLSLLLYHTFSLSPPPPPISISLSTSISPSSPSRPFLRTPPPPPLLSPPSGCCTAADTDVYFHIYPALITTIWWPISRQLLRLEALEPYQFGLPPRAATAATFTVRVSGGGFMVPPRSIYAPSSTDHHRHTRTVTLCTVRVSSGVSFVQSPLVRLKGTAPTAIGPKDVRLSTVFAPSAVWCIEV